MSPDTRGLLRAYSAFQNGVLPDPGGLYDQSACFVHALGVLSSEKEEIDKLTRK